MPSQDNHFKVLYLAGAGRSGGTLIGDILGQVPHFLYGGELRELWTPGLLVDRLCGCNTKLINCVFWQKVFDVSFGGLNNVDTTWMNRMRLQSTRTRQIPFTWLYRTINRLPPETQLFTKAISQVYVGLQKISNCSVIVDASRSISYAHLLESIPEIKLYIIHLIRDPRAVAFSWMRKRTGTTASRTVQLKQHKPLRIAFEWIFQNSLAELSWAGRSSYLKLRYEDFISNPIDNIHRILSWIDEPADSLGFLKQDEVNLKVCHSAAGNMYRLKTGWVPLKLDNEWETNMHHRDRALINIITWPWYAKYGYSLSA